MQRQSEGILLEIRAHGESSCICKVFTAEYGLVAGLVKGGRRKKSELTEGNVVQITHSRRLETQLGSLRLEVLSSPIIRIFDDMAKLQILRYQCELMAALLPEDMPQPKFYDRTKFMLETLGAEENYWAHLAEWELDILSAVGFGLSLTPENAVPCPDNSPLYYVSPRTGRAVSKTMGLPYHNKMLLLPKFFGGQEGGFLDVFSLTGHFLNHALAELAPYKKTLTTRQGLIDTMKTLT